MFKSYLAIICLIYSCILFARTEIINRSALPLHITTIIYEGYDGINRYPTIESCAYSVAPHETFSLDYKQQGAVSAFTVTFNSRKYKALLTAHTASTLLATAEGTIITSGAVVLEADEPEPLAQDYSYIGIKKL